MPAVPALPAASPVPSSARRCENCGAPLFGDHCHGCGQPIKGLVRHFSSVLGDFADTVFNIDSRVLRTLGPLLTRPGYLSLEYFTGRRVRYVTPMRLFLFLSLLAFFAIHANIEFDDDTRQGSGIRIGTGDELGGKRGSADGIRDAKTVAEVNAGLAAATARLEVARRELQSLPGAAGGIIGLEAAQRALAEEAEDRIEYLGAVDKATKAGKPPPPAPSPDDGNMNFPMHGQPWHPKTNPIDFDWLPASVNRSLNTRLGHAREVLGASKSQKPLVEALFNVLPQTLIVLMPLFALLLKIAYFFKRRLYMEHLIVALHSHAFIALALTLVVTFAWMRDSLVPDPGFWHSLLTWARSLTLVWIPLYLLLMQKRVYAQGWPMTLLKFGALGICYSVLLGFGLVAAMLIGLLTL